MVTAVVHHEPFGSSREALPSSVWHWTGVSPIPQLSLWQRPVFLVNSRPGSFHCGQLEEQASSTIKGAPLSRSYGANLPSS